MRRHLAILLVLAVMLTGCSGAFTKEDTLIVSGESLKASDKQFRRVAEAYVQGCDRVIPRQIPAPECTTFREFGERWNKAFPLAADLWLIAKEAGDSLTIDGARKAIAGLVAELARFTVTLLALFSAPAGGEK